MKELGYNYPFILMYQNNGAVINVESRFSPFYYESTLIKLKKQIEKTLELYKLDNINDAKIDELNRNEDEITKARLEEKLGLNEPYKKNKANRLCEKNGYVYLMIDNRNGYIKIGFSKTPEKREKTLQSEVPDICMFYNEKASLKDERVLHEMFNNVRVRGEWFNLKEDDIELIKTYLTNGTSL